MSLVSRVLEAGGITTVVIGSALDIVSHCGVPRFVFNDFPLGNPMGRPWDRQMQREVLEAALALVDSADHPGTIYHTGIRWGEDDSWQDAYSRVDDSNRQRLGIMGIENRQRRQQAKTRGLVRS